MTRKPRTPSERFCDRVDKRDSGGCWIWTGHKDKDGYGVFWYNGKSVRAHRFSYELYNGVIPSGMVCCHRCDNASCVNPGHLFYGTTQDNVNDRDSKMRASRGDSHWTRKPGASDVYKGSLNGNSRLSESDVDHIRKCADTGISLSNRYGVSTSLISAIRNRKMWRHI